MHPPVLWNIIHTIGLFSKIERKYPKVSQNEKNNPDFSEEIHSHPFLG